MAGREPIDDLIDAYVLMRRTERRLFNKVSAAQLDRPGGYGAFVATLTKSEKALNAEMLSLRDYASKHPTRWHDIGPDEGNRRAARLLAERGVIEVRQSQNQFRLKSNGIST